MKNAMRILLLLLALSLCLMVAGCKDKSVEETVPTGTEPVTVPVTEPEEEEEEEEFIEEIYSIPVGAMQPHPNGANGNTGIYFKLEPNEVPADNTWATEFRPRNASVVQLYRDGEVYDVANPMTGMIVKYSETDYYLKTEEWANRKYFPLQSGDVLKIEGDFKNATLDISFRIDTTYILFDEGLVFFGTEYPDESVGAKVINVGPFTEHPNGMNPNGFYACAPGNSAPVTDWSVEYKAVTEDAIQLIRGGQTYNVGNPAAGRLIKYKDNEYFIKMEQWIIKDLYPLQDGDSVKIEGNFANSATGILMKVKRTYVAVNQGMIAYSSNYPTKFPTATVVNAGVMSKHPDKGWTSTAAEAGRLYFTLEPNDIPYGDDGIRFTPRAEANVKLIRNGVTYTVGHTARETIVKVSDTGYIFEFWVLADHKPVRDGDILLVEGEFINSATRTILKISKTYVAMNEGLAAFSTTYPTEMPKANVVDAGVMEKHPEKGWTSSKEDAGRLYFTMAPNDAPYDASGVRYVPNEEACVKLIRDGVTYTVGHKARETIVKLNATDYIFEFWVLADHKPVKDGDILIVEGKFTNAASGTVINISKTYVAMNAGMAEFSTEYPEGPVGPEKIQGGTLQTHPEGWVQGENGGMYFRLNNNDAPFDSEWSLLYSPTSAGNVKLIRDGITYEVANPAAEMITKYRENDYYLAFWPIKQKPIVDGDILVIEGSFVNFANNVAIEIEKSYVVFENGKATIVESLTTEINVGYMQEHSNGWNSSSNDGLYFKLSANDVPYDGWNVEYEPASSAAIQLVRDGQTYNIGQPGKGTIVKYGSTEYYLKLSAWTIGDYFPIQPGDELIVEGKFKNADNGVVFSISRSVITVGEDYSLSFRAEEPVDPTIQAGMMSNHPNGWNTTNNTGLYFSMQSNDVPFSDDWKTFYYPTTAENIKLIRDGHTVNVAKTDREYIVKYQDTGYYLKLEKWTIGDYAPIVPGDVLIVEGKFENPISGVIFNIDKTYITVGEGYLLTFSDTAPEEEPGEDKSIVLRGIKPHENGFNTSSMDGLYFNADANTAPYEGWNIEYTPVAATNYKLVRGDKTYEIGIPGRGTLVKFSDTAYYLKFGWCVGDYANTITVGDKLIMEGQWRQNTGGNAVIQIPKTVITIGEGYTLTFETEDAEEPEPAVNHGPMAANRENGWTPTGGLYFTMKANDLPYDGWNVRYTPTAEGNVKLIRNGQTYNVAHTLRETICKYSETNYYYEFWTLDTYKPVVAGDILIVEGDFVNKASGDILTIAKTTITFNADGTATFESEVEEPEGPEITEPEDTTNHGAMYANSTNGWTATGGLYFTMQANDLTYTTDFTTRFTPVSESCVKLVRGGQTYNVAHTLRETICKFSETDYYYEFWTLDTYKPVVAGDILIVEGDFINKSSGEILSIALTTITFNEDGTATFESEEVEEEEEGVLNVGPMTENSSGLSDNILYFTLAENELPSGLTKSDFRPVSADAIRLIRDGVMYNVANPGEKTIVKQTASKYRLLRGALTMELQPGDILIVDGKFTGGNTGAAEVYTIAIQKTYIVIGNGTAVFSTEPPADE